MPITLTVQSLVNALAHVVSVLSTGDRSRTRDDALAGAPTVLRAIEDLLLAPRDLGAREHALRGAAACAARVRARQARRAARARAPARRRARHRARAAARGAAAALHRAPARRRSRRSSPSSSARSIAPDLDAYLHDLLVRAGAPVSLDALGATRAAVASALATRARPAGAIARDAQHGLRPPGRGGAHRCSASRAARARSPGRRPRDATRTCSRCTAAAPRRHARAPASRDRRPRSETAVVGLARRGGAERWYAVRYGEAGAGSDPEVLRAIARVEAALARGSARATILAGFSQGACLALEVAARHDGALGGVIAPCGARIGQPGEWGARRSRRSRRAGARSVRPSGDKWIARADLDATVAWFARRRRSRRRTSADRATGTRSRCASACARASSMLGAAARRRDRALATRSRPRRLPGAVPALQNSPRVPPYGLYAEQLNGTGFTAPRADNQRTWLYRVRPVGAAPRVRAARTSRALAGSVRRRARDQPVRLRAARPTRRRARLRRRARHAVRRRHRPRSAAATRFTSTPRTAAWSTARSTTPTAIC